jgi:hypothetical protein
MAIFWQDWEEATKAHHVTIADIVEMKADTTLSFICMDRNVWDIALQDKTEENKIYKALDFFQNNMIQFTRNDNEKLLAGTFDIIDVEPLENFELHIEYSPGQWYPLSQGKLPRRDPQGFAKFPWNLDRRQPERLQWQDYPRHTHVGYRGPWVKMKDVLPDIIY